jgi:hypothetical protein
MDEKDNINPKLLQLKSNDLLIITGMGMTMQSAQLNTQIDMRWLVARLLAITNFKRNEDEHTNEVLNRWLKAIPPMTQYKTLMQALHDELPVVSMTSWIKLIEINQPIITQTMDLHAALIMYFHIHQCMPEKLDDLNEVILTWSSSIEELELFFQNKTKKILYREGCILYRNCLLGKNYSKGGKSIGMKFINKMIRQMPLLMIGTLSTIRSAPLKDKLHDLSIGSNSEIFRIVQKDTPSVQYVNDILCDDYKEGFEKTLDEVCTILK